jgi:hypothetical protein
LDIKFSELTPNEILTSPIFGFQDLIPESHDKSKFIIPETTYQHRKIAQKVDSDITNFLNDDKTNEILKLINQE